MPLIFDFASLLRRAFCGSGKPLQYSLAVLVVAAAGCLTATVPTWIDVTTIIHDEDTAVPPNQYLMRSDHYNGVFQATYTNTANTAGAKGMRSQIDAGGGSWILYLGNQSLRTIWLTLASQGAPVPDGYYSANVEVYSQCFDVNNLATGWLVISPGSSNNRCTLGVDFSNYKLVMGPTTPGTGWASVSCNGGDSQGMCNNWTITPYTGGDNPTVANLYEITKSGKVLKGAYHNTYRIDVTNP